MIFSMLFVCDSRVDRMCMVPSSVLSVYYDKICIKFASHHLLVYEAYICQKSLNFTYAFKCYQQKCKWLHFSWATLYKPCSHNGSLSNQILLWKSRTQKRHNDIFVLALSCADCCAISVFYRPLYRKFCAPKQAPSGVPAVVFPFCIFTKKWHAKTRHDYHGGGGPGETLTPKQKISEWIKQYEL